MTVQEAIKIGFDSHRLSKLKKAEAKEVLKTLTRHVQKDIKELKKMGSPGAAKVYKQYGGKAPTMIRGLTGNQMKHYIGVLTDYELSGTATVKDTQDWLDKMANTFSRGAFQFDIKSLTPRQRSKFFEYYNDVTNSGNEEYLTWWNALDSNQRAELIMDVRSRKFKSADERYTYFYNQLKSTGEEALRRRKKGF